MSTYQALYRKFRPATFEEVKGQDHIVTTLKNQIVADRIGHAYLFCGTRGTGKTSIAKLFAKAVNCENPVDGSPCGTCAACKSIQAGASMNVVEIDAASNNGVDNIREIVDEVSYSPTEGKFRVYIIDEVHMLSIGAFNALLKTLEEPPSYVIFILATTEANKIPITILSRCQRYDFHRISIESLVGRMQELIGIEQVTVDDKALRFIAKCADGSMRDALSLLDQCIAFYLGQELTYDKVLEVLGAVDTEVYSEMLRKIIDKDIIGAIHMLEEMIMKGRELTQFVSDFTWYMRNLLLVKSSDHIEDVLDVSSENLQRLKEESQLLDVDTLMRYIRIFSELAGQIKYSTQKRVMIEMAIIKLCKPSMETNMDSILDRIRSLEEQVEHGIPMAAPAEGIPMQTAEPRIAKPKVPLPKALPEDIQKVQQNWGRIVNEMDGLVKAMLKEGKLSVHGDSLLIVFEDKLKKEKISSPETMEALQAEIAEFVEKEVSIEVKLLEEGQVFDETYPDISKMILTDVEIEDE